MNQVQALSLLIAEKANDIQRTALNIFYSGAGEKNKENPEKSNRVVLWKQTINMFALLDLYVSNDELQFPPEEQARLEDYDVVAEQSVAEIKQRLGQMKEAGLVNKDVEVSNDSV